jgi:hypothetical protein
MASLDLSSASRRAFERMAADCRRVFDNRFVAVVAYGASEALVLASSVGPPDLEALGALTETWHRDGLATPLVMTPDEFVRTLDAFPLEYQAILDRHQLIAGAVPFDGIRISPDDLRRACEIQQRAHLIQLREGWLEAGGHHEELAELIERSAAPLRALLANIARLNGRQVDDAAALAGVAQDLTGMPGDLVREVLTLETDHRRSRALVPRLPEYLDAAERLWVSLDRWRSR